jgi:hypothetical protein
MHLNDFVIEHWVKGTQHNISQFIGSLTLVEVIQVNCPGCFTVAIPKAIELHEKYASKGLRILIVATAFEDFGLNNLKNLEQLVVDGSVAGETRRVLSQLDLLRNGRFPIELPFSIAMDHVEKRTQAISIAEVDG